MVPPYFRALLVAMAALATSRAADIEGTVVIKRKLTRKTVTASASLYQRGVSVDLAPDPQEDPLAFERTRVVIFLEGKLSSLPVTAAMEQKNRRFLPDLLVVPAGSTVSFPNLDLVFHNVFSLSKPKSFDLGNYPKGQTRTVTFSRPGIVFVHCHLHPNMGAAIVVTPNRWCAKADASGRFVLRGVPAGDHTLTAWHKTAGFFRQTVRVDPDRGATVEFYIPTDESGNITAVAQR